MIEIYEWELEEQFDDMINDLSPPVNILGVEYSHSLVLKRIDTISYRCAFNDWLDNEIEEGYLKCIDNKYWRDDEHICNK